MRDRRATPNRRENYLRQSCWEAVEPCGREGERAPKPKGSAPLALACALFALSVAFAPATRAANGTLQGRVYVGDVGNESTPLAGVAVAVYGANDSYSQLGVSVEGA